MGRGAASVDERQQLIALLDNVICELGRLPRSATVTHTREELDHHREQIAYFGEVPDDAMMDRLLSLLSASDALIGRDHEESAAAYAQDLWPVHSGVQIAPYLFELSATHGSNIARAVLEGHMVPAPLDPAPVAGERMRVIFEVEDFDDALVLWAESTGIVTPDGVMLVLAPLDEEQRDNLLALANDELETLECQTRRSFCGPDTVRDSEPYADPILSQTGPQPATTTLPSLFESDEFDDDAPWLNDCTSALLDEPSTEIIVEVDIDEPVLTFGRYELLERIGRGAMATVYRGRIVSSGGFERQVAMKVMHPHLAADQDFESMFLDEARLAARIHHPNVVATIDVFRDNGTMMLVMDYVAGPTLKAVASHARVIGAQIPPGIAARIACDILAGAHAAHELVDANGEALNLVHRDVSPGNVLIGRDGVTRISDFGVAKARVRLITTNVKTLKGKVAYMAPEQARCESVGRTADVYSAGVVLWELLTGKRLFNEPNDVATLGRVLKGVVPAPDAVDARVPSVLAGVCMRALSNNPLERYPDAASFSDAIEVAAQACGVRVATTRELARFIDQLENGAELSLSESLYPNQTQPETQRSGGDVTDRRPSSRRALPAAPVRRTRWAAIIAVVLGVVLGAAVSLFVLPLWRAQLLGAAQGEVSPIINALQTHAANAMLNAKQSVDIKSGIELLVTSDHPSGSPESLKEDTTDPVD